ncbi:MAG: alpha/beta hydrolase [Chlorobi bacterium]|nr:alpha/beta hydrolase [Chlorobiota bacterium]
MKKIILLCFAIISLLVFGCESGNDLGKFVEAPSPVKPPQALIDRGGFTYGYMKVPELHNKPHGKAIELAVAVFKSQADSATREPLILITGGPGLSDMDSFLPELFGDLGTLFLNNRDIVIVELRGLKYSKPNLFCPELDSTQMALLDKNLTPEETVDLYLDALKRAYNRFERNGVDLSAFNDYEIASDIVYVMDHLGYEKFSVFGSSFGTLVVQHLLLNHSGHMVSAVLNAVVNMDSCFYNMHTNSIKTLDAIFEKCENDEKLNQAYPDLKNRFLALLKRLNEHPDTLMVKNPADGKMYKLLLNGSKLSVWIFTRMYWDTQIPLTLHKILSGDYSEIINDPGMLFPLPDFSYGLSLSIITSEFSTFKDENIPVNGEYADFVKGCGTLVFTPYFINKVKKVWKVNDLSRIKKTLDSDVPVLMLSGELDHVCPPADAVALSKKFKNAYVYVFPGVAHSPIDAGMCGIMMMKEFIDNPAEAPDASCVKEFHTRFLLPE